jgi:hemerythrin
MSERLKAYVAEIRAEHEVVFSMIRSLGDGTKYIDIVKYIFSHVSREEYVMLATGFVEISEHREEHARVLAELWKNQSDADLEHLRRWLTNFLESHVDTYDARLITFIEAKDATQRESGIM